MPGPDSTPGSAPASASLRLGMESISDVVFGLALSIGSVVFVVRFPTTVGDLYSTIAEFGFSFLIVIMVWLSYRRSMVVLKYETRATVVVNVALLFGVSIEPFLLYVLVTSTTVTEAASTAYALDLGATMLLLSTHNHLLLEEERRDPIRRVHPRILERTRRSTWVRVGIGAIFLVSALPVFWVPAPVGGTARIDLWFLSLAAAFLVLDLVLEKRRERPEEPLAATQSDPTTVPSDRVSK